MTRYSEPSVLSYHQLRALRAVITADASAERRGASTREICAAFRRAERTAISPTAMRSRLERLERRRLVMIETSVVGRNRENRYSPTPLGRDTERAEGAALDPAPEALGGRA